MTRLGIKKIGTGLKKMGMMKKVGAVFPTADLALFILKPALGKISILFVIDTSRSMTEELQSIGSQFDPFLSTIRTMDYRVAIVTADSMDGSFLVFSNGQSFLSNPEKENSKHRENVKLFQEKMAGLTKTTAGEDERGIFVLNQVLRIQAESGFFVPHSLFMAIIVSDEDERTYGGKFPQLSEGCFLSGDNTVLPLEEDDKPGAFFQEQPRGPSFCDRDSAFHYCPSGKLLRDRPLCEKRYKNRGPYLRAGLQTFR